MNIYRILWEHMQEALILGLHKEVPVWVYFESLMSKEDGALNQLHGSYC